MPVHPPDTIVRILTVGLPVAQDQGAIHAVAKRYGMEFYAVTGCVVTRQLLDSVQKENQQVKRILAEEYGKDWRKGFEADVTVMKRLQQEATEIVQKESFIISKATELEKDHRRLEYFVGVTKQDNIFLVKAYGWESHDNQSNPVTYYEVTVDLAKKKVIQTIDRR